MRSPTGLDDPTAPSQSDGEVEQTISDEATRKLLKGVIVAMAAIVVIGLFAGAAIWALDGDDEPDAPMNAVDVGFLQDMLDHHEQALLISNLYIDNNPDGDAVPYADEVIMFQTRDMGWMRDWLADEGHAPGEPDRMAMQWMNEPVPVAEMTGMQTPERLAGARRRERRRRRPTVLRDHDRPPPGGRPHGRPCSSERRSSGDHRLRGIGLTQPAHRSGRIRGRHAPTRPRLVSVS